jgi:hypothetical protein
VPKIQVYVITSWKPDIWPSRNLAFHLWACVADALKTSTIHTFLHTE